MKQKLSMIRQPLNIDTFFITWVEFTQVPLAQKSWSCWMIIKYQHNSLYMNAQVCKKSVAKMKVS